MNACEQPQLADAPHLPGQLQEQLANSYADLEAKVAFRNLDLERQVQELQQRLAPQ